MGVELMKGHNCIEVSHEAQIIIAQLQLTQAFRPNVKGISASHILCSNTYPKEELQNIGLNLPVSYMYASCWF